MSREIERWTKQRLEEEAVAEGLKRETASHAASGIAETNARREAIARAIPEGLDCDVTEVAKCLAERARQARGSGRGR